MGLSAPKRKARLIGSASGRNTAWTDDASLPGQRLLASMGWSQGQGLGTSSQGTAVPIAMAFKMDNKGIGARRHEREARENGKADAWIGGGGELGDLFERLNKASSSTSPVPEESGNASGDVKVKSRKEEKEERRLRKEEKRRRKAEKAAKGKEREESSEANADPVKIEEAVEKVAAALPHRLASRARFLRAKRMVGTDQVSVNEILGISSSSGTASPAIQTPLSLVSSPAPVPPSQPDANASTVKSGKRKRDDPERIREKEEKRARKEAKRAAKEGKGEAAEIKVAIKKDDAASDLSFAAGGGMKISSLSVQDYLQAQLMKKKAAIIRKKRGEESSLWSRAAAVHV